MPRLIEHAIPTLNYAMLFTLLLMIYACDSNTPETLTPTSKKIMITLNPLSPYQYKFTTQDVKKNANIYFFTTRENWRNKPFRKALEKQLETIHQKASENFMFFSVYIYARTEQLNENFKGDNNSLQGVYDADLISYTRWKQGKLDIFYFIDSGNVVFDALKDTEVAPTWEFD